MNVLHTIVEHKREEVADLKRSDALLRLRDREPPPVRDFKAALRAPGISAICEIKRRSPSKGELRPDLDVVGVAERYARSGAAALSVLTDERFFGGQIDDLVAAREAADGRPVLRKDFTIDAIQIEEARLIGADAVLLIVRILSDTQLRDFLAAAEAHGLAALVEVHDEAELARALACGARVVGVNNRDLDTFHVDLETCLRLKRDLPPGCTTVAESGIHSRADVERVLAAGFDAILVGESLMRAADPGEKLADLLGAAV